MLLSILCSDNDILLNGMMLLSWGLGFVG